MLLAYNLIIVFLSVGLLCFLIGWFEVGYMANAPKPPRRASAPRAARGGSAFGNWLRRLVGLPQKKPRVDYDGLVANFNEIEDIQKQLALIESKIRVLEKLSHRSNPYVNAQLNVSNLGSLEEQKRYLQRKLQVARARVR